MKRALLCLLALASTAHAKLQYMECKGENKNGWQKVIKGNVDPEAGTSQTLLVFQNLNDKPKISEYVYAREIRTLKAPDGRTQLWTDWMHDFTLTLPRAGSDEATVEMSLQDGITEAFPAPMTCVYKDESEERLLGRELCFNHRGYCVKFGSRYPNADEREQFLKDAIEYEKTKPILAVRRLVRCEGTMPATKTTFVLQGTMGVPVGENPTSSQYTVGPFIVNASTAGTKDTKFRFYPSVELSLENDWQTKTVHVKADKDVFTLNRSYDGTNWDAVIKGEKTGMTQSFAGKMSCKEERLAPDELAGFEHCHEMYLGCLALRRARGVDLPTRDDLDDLRAYHKLEVGARRRNLN